ncbi:MAG TPA: FAD-dependent oxidoreductase [Gaiellaceae bacterium]|jgi:sulfide:quinone oxidoreductase
MAAQRVVVAGAGVAGLEAALALRALAGDLVEVEVIAPEPLFVYRPAAVAEPFAKGVVRRFPLDRLVAAAGARFRHDLLVALDEEQKSVRLNSGDTLEYGMLVVAVGARPTEAVPGALTFRGAEDKAAMSDLLERANTGALRQLVFAIPAGVSWPLPLYELAFLTSEHLAQHCTRNIELVLLTAEERPLALFGDRASDAIARLLGNREIRIEAGRSPHVYEDGVLHLTDGGELAADAVVALPRQRGHLVEGLPQDERGFVATDEFGRVEGLTDVYAAGDLTRTSIKQGGIAAQEADAVASAIAAELGAPVKPTPVRPILRGLLLTGTVPQFLRSEPGQTSEITSQPLWWPPAKLVGRYLSPFLAEHLGLSTSHGEPREGDIAINVAVDTHSSAPV